MGGGLEMLVCDDAARTDQSEQTNKHWRSIGMHSPTNQS
jgi:hypothetical protein